MGMYTKLYLRGIVKKEFIPVFYHVINYYKITYRLLSALESIKKDITDTANIRLELINILKNVSDEWDS